MRAPRPLVILVGCLFVSAIIATTADMRSGMLPSSAVVNSAPVAGDDTYTRHGNGTIGPLLQNDSDPDSDPMHVQIETFPAHGNLSGLDGNSFNYVLSDQSFAGTDTFTYKACDNQNACSNVATVTIDIVNQAPVANNDSYTVHGTTTIGPMLVNDFDPDGDPFNWVIDTAPSHGALFGLTQQDLKSYVPVNGYAGPDSFTYKACDQFGLCSSPATVTLSVDNNAPVAGADSYVVRGITIIGPLFANDSDPDEDSFNGPSLVTAASHGRVFGLEFPTFPIDLKRYEPDPGYAGTDSFQYEICDSLGACATTTVTLFVLSDGEDNGGCSQCPELGGSLAVGSPVNVTNGNMYVQQSDYNLPGVGHSIDVTRTYNSDSQSVGLFGRGWSTAYDESILSYDGSLLRFNQADGRAIYFGRAVGATGAFTPLVGDFHGGSTQDGNGFTVSMKDGSIHQFNAAGKLTSLIDLNGNTTALTYDANGFLTAVTDPSGRVLAVTPDPNGRILSIADTMGTIATYTYDSDKLLSVTYADNSAFHFGHDGSLRVNSVTDALGNVVEAHTYDTQGRALTSERHGGVELYTLNYVSDTLTEVTDARGNVTKYTVDKSKGRNVVTQVEGLCNCGGGGSEVQTWTYDDDLNVTVKTDALNHISTFTYDDNGNRLTETDTTGTVTYTYQQFGGVLTRLDQLDGLTTNTYDPAGKLLTTRDALNNISTFTYTPRGELKTATDAREKLTTFTYDPVGNLKESKDANNIITFYFYDARSRLTKVRDGLSRSTLYAYDLAGRLKKVTHPDLSFMTFTYDLAGRRTIVTDERGKPTTYAYDNAYRLESVTDALSHETSYGYDLMSNLTSMTDALSRVTDYEYDDFNRLKKTIYPPAIIGATRLFETLAYDAAGNVERRTDTAGRITEYEYDDLNRLETSTDANNKSTSFEYDELSRTKTVVDALSQRYEFAYDLVGRQIGATRGGVSMSYEYDAVGNRTQRTDYNGVVTNYAYDNLNRLTTVTYPTRTATYAYDPLNNMTRATNENGSVYVSYDNRYRVSSFSDPFYYGVSYNYDTAGNRTKLKLNGATYATYTYDDVNRLTNLADSANQNFPHSYDPVNRLESRSAPNGVTSSYAYDDLNRLTALTHATGATTLIGNQYAYNDANNITNWTNASGNHAYGYDLVDRLSSATNSAQANENYSYDGVGNRTTSHLSASYSYQPFNKLTSTATATYAYDNNGNLLSKTDASGITAFTWNEENQLTQVSLPGGLTVNHKYDGLGRRVQRTTSTGANERYVYDGRDVLLDLNADWSVATTYLNGSGIDNHLRQTNATTGVSYFLSDHLGSTSGLTDASGALVEQLTYDSFGNSAGSSRTRYGYTGRERDPDTGQLYYRARFYDAQLGRFLSEDPVGLKAGINLYSYGRNNPTRFTDPTGENPFLIIGGILVGEGLIHSYLADRANVFFPPDRDPHLRKQHCYVNCMSLRIHAGNPLVPTHVSVGIEVPSLLIEGLYRGNLRRELSETAGDLAADAFGQAGAFIIWKSCKDICEQCLF